MNDQFKFENVDETTLVISLGHSKLDGVVSPELKSILVAKNREGFSNIIIDLTETRYCDSSGLSAILVGNRLCKNSEGTFVLCGLQPMVMKLITISQLTNILNIVPTLQEAKDYVMMEKVERELRSEE